ncbi:MAG: enoyl-CoA hydratase-related protein [Legionellaceae bacterium]
MTHVLTELTNHVLYITLNRIEKHNAFDDTLIDTLQRTLDSALDDPKVRILALKANGRHFSAGADLAWMHRMASYTEAENLADAKRLARLLATLSDSPKPTLAIVQGAAYGGGAGLVAACDIALAGESALFCFSEVTLGLIPAVISPYVIRAVGERAASWLFMSGERLLAQRALTLNLIQHCVKDEDLLTYAIDYANQLVALPHQALYDCKSLVRSVAHCPIDETLQTTTASLIAKKRVSSEGQAGLKAFLHQHHRN